MPTKNSSKQLKKAHTKTSRNGKPHKSRIWHGSNIGFALNVDDEKEFEIDSSGIAHPVQINPETSEEREKRLAARKARTLKAFQLAYKNRHQRKAS